MLAGDRLADAIARARAHSPFLASALQREPAIASACEAGALTLDLAEIAADQPITVRLRRRRRALALTVALGDLAGLMDLTAVTGALTRFADGALDEAIAAAIFERTPDAELRGFTAIALGKQGSGELNYSSDIDPILLYDPSTLPRRAREEPADAAVRIARRVVELLQARDADGYVLRVDLRLRPSPEVTPIALPVDAAIGHYESQALPWERAAFIRARAAAGDLALGRRFLAAVRPFVWRRALDFGAIGEIRALTHRIRDHYAGGQAFGPGYDLKRGRGGIREVEFFAQVQQLIHGGRDPSLRAPATRDALAALAAAGRIGADEAASLTEAYTALRTIEHRLQMVDDRQTHTLPSGAALDGVARLHGLTDGAALLAMLRPHVAATARRYDALDDGAPAGASLDLLGRLGETGAQRVAQWRAATYPALRSAPAQAALEAVLPILLPAFAAAPEPDKALLRFDRLLERLSSAVNFLRLLQARPGLALLLTQVLSHAPPLAEELGRRPALLDGLIDASALAPVGDVEALTALLRAGDVHDYGSRLDHVRRVVGELRFASGVQIVAGAADPLAVAGGYSRIAEATLEVLAEAAVAEFARAHGRVPDSELVILGLGRLGGGALTHASDLDLVYLFTGDFRAESDGPKPLGATLYYNRLAQRVTAALSVPTAAGPLYPVDTRLRPSGAHGPLAVSLDSFARYQREEAWTWEHMALTRARPMFGSPSARAATQAVIDGVLAGDRPVRDIVADAAAMRAEMAAHKPPQGPFDAKLLPGGLVDLEFAVHVAQLTRRTAFTPRLDRAVDALVAAGLAAPALRDAHDLLTGLLVTLRLVAPDAAAPDPGTATLVARALGLPDWAAVVASLAATRQEVERYWREVTGDGNGNGAA
ncbi:bifunctional [glutamine synthetase] adenylyltransferase/[glutamine synthetase]-adenylyl-L-tyrosine phosphorylase [uncultured Sphingomonas sp.]|uniref:bifunctional [glutamine synthetase] adenylyltransferase/[glutamine synthetase]-adenylyl-L-tyrosine phosphorylase n=1 Tax=uncultured Sphingomonas sp. TaxID=158754 RepID=UPI0035CA9897